MVMLLTDEIKVLYQKLDEKDAEIAMLTLRLCRQDGSAIHQLH